MGKDYKTSKNELWDIAEGILELPERVKRLNVVTSKELLIELQKHKDNRNSFICDLITEHDVRPYSYPDEYKPDKLVEYWQERISSKLGNYNNIGFVMRLIQNHINHLQIDKVTNNKPDLIDNKETKEIKGKKHELVCINKDGNKIWKKGGRSRYIEMSDGNDYEINRTIIAIWHILDPDKKEIYSGNSVGIAAEYGFEESSSKGLRDEFKFYNLYKTDFSKSVNIKSPLQSSTYTENKNEDESPSTGKGKIDTLIRTLEAVSKLIDDKKVKEFLSIQIHKNIPGI